MAEKVTLKPINVKTLLVTIEGMTPLIQHQWDEKNKELIRQKQAGKKTKSREVRDPEAEAQAAMYVTEDGQPGISVSALAKCIVGAAHKDIGIEKTLVRKSLFIVCNDRNKVLPMECSEPRIREDTVRVGQGGADLRYRPEFETWACTFEVQFNADMLTPADIFNLINLAGFGVGINEWRPEKGGEYGRFRVKATEEV